MKLPFLLLLGLLAMIYIKHHQPESQLRARTAEYAPVKGFEHWTLGYRESAADSLWLNVIQHMDLCPSAPSLKATPPPEFVPDDPLKNLLGTSRPPSRCHFSWVYHMIDRITDAAPRFRMAYSAGATMLSVIVDDRAGATAIFEKGIGHIKDDWNLEYKAAYHMLFELGDGPRAAKLLVQAAQHGGPDWLLSLAANIYSKTGQALLAKSVLENSMAQMEPGPNRKRLEQRLNEIEYALEKSRKTERQPTSN